MIWTHMITSEYKHPIQSKLKHIYIYNIYCLKGQFTKKKKILSSFTRPQVALNLYDFFLILNTK